MHTFTDPNNIDYEKINQQLTGDLNTTNELAGAERIRNIAQELAQKIIIDNRLKSSKNLIQDIKTAREELLQSYFKLTKEVEKKSITPASEWFLDNFHIIEEQLRSIKRDLPTNYYEELPKIKEGELKGYPRVYAIARTIVEQGDARLDIETIEKFIKSFQEKSILTIGELWAVAITLRISLIQNLLPLVRRILSSLEEHDKADKLADKILELAVISDKPQEKMLEAMDACLCHNDHFKRPFIVQLIQRLRDQDPEVFRTMESLEEVLHRCRTSSTEVIQLEHYRQAADQVSVGNIITSMRLFSTIDWHDFFEEVSLVDSVLAQDPDGTYRRMDIATRDSYRKVIERLSKNSGTEEIEVARIVLEVARRENTHIGFHLLEQRVQEIEKKLSYSSPWREQITRFLGRHPTVVYFGSLLLILGALFYHVFDYFHHDSDNPLRSVGIILLLFVPLSELSIGILHYLITLVKKPKRLPKNDYQDGVPQHCSSMVVVPCLFTNAETIKELVHNLEVQYLANQDNHIYFSLLGDLVDADQDILESDKELLNLVHYEIMELNRRYSDSQRARFYVFHRARLYNPAEGKWMGWERKRGKIHEFNYLLRGSEETTYITTTVDKDFLSSIKYVITLDADSQLPLQSARRLIGTITHPLNQPLYDEEKKSVVKGYGIIQPRISVSLVSAAKTRFAQIFSGNTGIDPYTTAVSDVYQDLFGEGSFVGKGLYDVDIFNKVLQDKIPENAILSHDLFEGSYTRVGLVTDVEMIDDYPSNFEIFCKRMHRWTRGDWQLLPWLFPYVKNSRQEKVKNELPLVARWKIFDNLRRSLLAPMTLVWLLLAWFVLPGSALMWTLAILLTMVFPVFASTLQDMIKGHNIPWPEHIRNNLQEGRNRVEQVFLMLVYMPEISVTQIDAIIRALYRMIISKKHMLEWVSFSQIQNQQLVSRSWKGLLTTGPVFALALGITILITKPEVFIIAQPFLLSWLITPYITLGTQRPLPSLNVPLSEDEVKMFRRYARLTWHYFETFASEQENWLAPDNFQEDPKPVIAHRTSPTNIGLQLLANLSAYDLGYLGMNDFLTKTEHIINTLHKLEKLNGHLFNWYNTQTLEPLNPRYISTVDSGNLAGHLITLKQACLELAKSENTLIDKRQGLKDSFVIYEEYLKRLLNLPDLPRGGSLKRLIHTTGQIAASIDSASWSEIHQELNRSKKLLADLVYDDASDYFTPIYQWMDTIILQLLSYQQDDQIDHTQTRLRLKTIAYQAHELAHEMDFKFLFDPQRKIFAIGHNVTEARRDDSYYDLLASEARLTSFFAISKGDITDEHWFRLGRQLTSAVGSRALISWSATMFEYLMPLLVMKRFEDTLLDQTYESVVRRQIEYGRQRQIPWGISEAGYNARDLEFNYQYGPFGIPGLGLKRGLRDELVVSPYSTMLAAMILPREALFNLQQLEKLKALGHYGFYESIDYTPERVPKNKRSVILHSYMAHHQGMSLLSLNNLLNNSILQERFHADARNEAIQLLLQERIPKVTEITKPRVEETHIESFARMSLDHHTRIYEDPSLSTPRTQILSNGNYSLMLSTAASGFSKCQDRMLSRWREDPVQDNYGQFIFIKNITSGKIWSSGYRPTNTKPKKYEAIFAEDKIEFYREDEDITTITEIIVSSEDNVELRRVSLTNRSNQTVEIEVTSYMEVALARAADDSAHPAFSKLFVQTEYHPQINALLATRRPRSSTEKEYWGLHSLAVEGVTVGEIEFETDRAEFLGRGRTIKTPQAIMGNQKLGQGQGAVLDPIFSLRQRVKIPPNGTTHFIFATGLTGSKDEAMRLAEKYLDPNNFIREVNLGWVKSQMTLRHLNITMKKAHLYQRLAGRILYLAPSLRAKSKVYALNHKQQSALWAHGISGDLPVILVKIRTDKDIPLVRDLLHAHEYLRLKGIILDLLILNEHATSYLQTLQDEVMRQILISGGHHLLDKHGGIFVRRADLLTEEDILLFNVVARVNIIAERGSLEDQLRRRSLEKELPSPFIPTAKKQSYPLQKITPPKLTYFNGLGGFTINGKEYVIHLKANEWTPAPWINVIANKNDFGFIVSESGQGYSWSVNSRENRISSWSNDPVSDPSSEAIYIRDEETGSFWSPTPLPIRGTDDYLIHHGQGYSTFEHHSYGIHQHLTAFVPVEDTVKILILKLRNDSSKTRKLSVTSYIEWVLGVSHAQTSSTVFTQWEQEISSLLAMNTYNNEFASRVAFTAMSETPTSYTCDRQEFIGRNNELSHPDAMGRQGLSGREGGRLDPCGVLQTSFELKNQEEREIIILIGQCASSAEAKELIISYQKMAKAKEALSLVKQYWDKHLGALVINTPDPAMNMLINRWLLYQTLSCRYWARSAFYQSGGAFGFRDQLQDVMALVYSQPEITRAQIILAAARQFPEGDVQHWWHPPTGRGVRTRFSDDLLWLPYVVGHYLEVTQDYSILDEVIHYIETPPLTEGHDETYTQPELSSSKGSLYEHCVKAIDRSLKVGEHGLPLFGSGDWNDGMNRVGHLGRGESVWMAWFLSATLKVFIPYCERKQDLHRLNIYQEHRIKLKKAVEENAWDGQWYLRAYFDNGEPMGSHLNEECKIDAIAQSWSIISGMGETERAKMALESVDQNLIDRKNKIVKLFIPPFDKSSQDPGYIKGYVPGVRENGGQYTHAAIWTVIAMAQVQDTKRAYEIFSLINPINHSRTKEDALRYKVEPYVIAADIYGVPPHVGRGGWSWYTGSASWMYRAAIENLLGFRIARGEIILNPCIPPDWNAFKLTYHREDTVYEIDVLNHQDEFKITVDGVRISGKGIPLNNDGKSHHVIVNLASTSK